MKSLGFSLVISVAVAGAAFAADPAPTAEKASPGGAKSASKKAEKDPNKLICTREQDTGSFLAKRVCRTQAQIDEDRRAAAELNDRRSLLGGGRPDLPTGR